MNLLRGPRVRPAPSLLALVLFLLGSNYCVLSAWSGNARMACMTLPANDAPRCPLCAAAHHGPVKRGDARPSCCPAPVVVPTAQSIETAAPIGAAPVLAI